MCRGYCWLSLATIYLLVLYPLWVVDSLRTLNLHHCLSMVTTGCPLATIYLVGDNRDFEV